VKKYFLRFRPAVDRTTGSLRLQETIESVAYLFPDGGLA
jgi:hypothetical protein